MVPYITEYIHISAVPQGHIPELSVAYSHWLNVSSAY